MTAQQRFGIIAFFTLVLVIDTILYFRYARHFFQADTIFLIDHRAHSVLGYLREFVALNPSGWFRPLANELIESVFFPFAGLSPIPYRIPVYIVFAAVTIAVYALALALTRRPLAAGIATMFFNIHTVNAYVTYDLGFMPELLYALFYICAAFAFLQYVKEDNKRAYRLSLVSFVAALLSKESALTLPGMLFLTCILFAPPGGTVVQRLTRGFRSILPHAIIVAAYLAYAVGYLNVGGVSFAKMFDTSQKPNPGDYTLVLNSGIFENAYLAINWGFNIPGGWWGQWQNLTGTMIGFLEIFRALVILLAVAALIRLERRVVLFTSAWFWVTVLPTLPLISHFVPNYVFVPVVGLSILVGLVLAWAFDFIHRYQPLTAAIALAALFGGLIYVNTRSIRGNIRDNRLLGGSAKLAGATLSELQRFYPRLPEDATLYFADVEESLAWEHDLGRLIKTAYATDRLSVLYQCKGNVLAAGTRDPLVFGVRDGHLIDETPFYRSNSGEFVTFTDQGSIWLKLFPAQVLAGKGRYTLQIDGWNDKPVQLAYTLNDGPLQQFGAVLNSRGEVTFDVSTNTPRGVYKFWAFRPPGQRAWFHTDQVITVR